MYVLCSQALDSNTVLDSNMVGGDKITLGQQQLKSHSHCWCIREEKKKQKAVNSTETGIAFKAINRRE